MPKAAINGIELFWEEAGTGEPFLLLHGFPLDHTMWQGQIQYFSRQGWRVIAPDQRGYGHSNLISGEINSISQMAEDAAALLDYLELQKTVVMGLSMGGYVTLSLYWQFATKIRAMILADTKAEPDSLATREGRFKLRDAVEAKGSGPARDVMLPAMFSPKVYIEKPPMLAQLGKVMEQTRPETIMATLPGLAERVDSVPLLSTIRVPVLVIHGEEDQLMPVANARKMAEAIPEAAFVGVPFAGHMANLESPDFFNEQVEKFLKKLK